MNTQNLELIQEEISALYIPYFENCDDDNIEQKCFCPEKLDTSDNFYSKYPDVNIVGIPSYGQQWQRRCL